tara:strand:- start:103 stop:948 length:846 start_codon:yes stop_codon:yes gene_type:complete
MAEITKNLGYWIEYNKTTICDKKCIDEIKDLLKNYHLLVIKGLDFTVKEFKTFSGMLGEIIPHDILKYRHPEHEMLSYVTNVDREGNLDKFGATIRANDWHTDGSFRKTPYSYTILYSLEAPKKGGYTDFNNMVEAYKNLDSELISQIEEYSAFHKRGEGWTSKNPPPPLSDKQKASGLFEGNSHPIVIKNPISKKKTLYINPSHTKKINELDDEASDILLSKLINLSVTKKYQYSHQWQKKDLIIWDQRDLLHRASPEKVTNEKRIMIRSMILNKPHRII